MNRNFATIIVLGTSILANVHFLIKHFRTSRAQQEPTFYQKSIQSLNTVRYSEVCKRFGELSNSSCGLLFMGDSVPNLLVSDLEDKRNEGDLEEPWISVLNGGFRNRCISGVTTVGINQLLDKVTLPKSDNIFLWIGINDLLMKRTVSDIEGNYREILGKLRRADPKARIVVVSVLPVCNSGDDINASIAALNIRLTSIAKDAGAKFIDVRPAVVDATGNRDPASTWDGTHPNASALTRIEKIVADATDNIEGQHLFPVGQ